jgi:FkbM family methyltransferase
LKRVLKALIRQTPYRLVRAGDGNRFQAIEPCLLSLASRGFRPQRIIDGGANIGDFARCAAAIFPGAMIHLVEPQPACQDALAKLAREGRFIRHAVALGAEDGSIELATDPGGGVTTGAHILPGDAPTELERVQVPVARLDTLIRSELKKVDRSLLKLDLQGWEFEALKGAEQSLGRIEVILIEVSFFAQAYEPPIEILVRFLHEREFALYDIAGLAARRRDNRARQADFLFVRRDSPLMADTAWA